MNRNSGNPPPPDPSEEAADLPPPSSLRRDSILPAMFAPESVPPSIRESVPPESLAPDSLAPDSGPLAWIEESAPISGIPVSRQLPAAPDTSPVSAVASARASGIAREVLRLVFARRRLSAHLDCPPNCEACLSPHLAKVEAFIRQRRPIQFVLPAFPAKSPNPQKVLGRLPDMAERVALIFLQNLCMRIKTIYRPGAQVTICSDGLVFSDLVRVLDDDVVKYGDGIRGILGQLESSALSTYGLTDEFGAITFDQMRSELVTGFAASIPQIRERIAADPAALGMYNGISRFLFEDFTVLEPEKTRNQVRKSSKDFAYRMIQRSDAWSVLVERRFPHALRLSIHPQPAHHAKIGIHLVETLDNWLTPWHSTAVRSEGRYVLMKRYQAERLGATVVMDAGRPSHFAMGPIDLTLLREARIAATV